MEVTVQGKKLLRLLVSLLLLSGLPLAAAKKTDVRPLSGVSKNIIVFHSSYPTYPPLLTLVDCLSRELDTKFATFIKSEFLDFSSQLGKDYPAKLAATLEIKYQSFLRPDLLVCADDAALDFVLRYGSRLFPGTPVLACNIIGGISDKKLVESGRRIFVIKDSFAVADTVLTASRLFGNRNKLLLIGDANCAQASGLKPDVMSQLESFNLHFEIEYKAVGDLKQLENVIRAVDAQTIAVFVNVCSYHYKESAHGSSPLNALFAASDTPFFSITHTLLGSGIVGGKMSDPVEVGIESARLAVAILSGEKINTQHHLSVLSRYYFDQKVLSRFRIKPGALPSDSVIINRTVPGTYAQLLSWLPVIIGAFLFESMLLLGLLCLYHKNSIAHKELERREREWQSLTENLPDIIYRIDSKGKCQYINQSVERTLNLKVEDLIGKTTRYLKAPSFEPEAGKDDTQEVFLSGQPRSREIRLETSNGPVILESRFVPEPDASGKIVNVLGISRDITQQKKASRELALQQFAIANAQLPIMVLNQEGKVHFANTAAVEFFGGDAGGLEGRRFVSFPLRSDDFVSPSELFEVVKAKRNFRLSCEYVPEGGPMVPVEMIFNCLQVEKDEFVCLFIRDISSQKKVEQEMMSAKERAEKSDQLKSSFLANVSHEIRTPLNGILGFAELLKHSDPDPEEREKYIDIINESGKTLLQIIEDILDISKIESGQIKIVAEDFQLVRMLHEVYELFNHKILSGNGKLKLVMNIPDWAKENGFPVRSDEIRLRQILNNLISNAVKFTREGTIEVGCRLLDDQVEVYVKDTGIGISEEKQQLIFEPFRQADESISRTYGGTGLGLAIASSYAKLLGGSIKLKSHVGQGSTFTLAFPRGTTAEFRDGIRPDKVQPHNYRWANRKILVAEDDRTSFLFINKILSDTGATVLHVESGSEAVRVCQVDHAVDAVLMDVRLPDLNGWEATRKIKSRRPNLPIIIETANALNQDREKSADCGSDGFLTKPIRKEDLLEALAQFLEKG